MIGNQIVALKTTVKSGVVLVTTLLIAFSITSCKTMLSTSSINAQPVNVPYLKNNANECYFLDDFMPTPDGMVSGRSGALNLRYYSYKIASYKELKSVKINLAFYSSDQRCWSLFEEFYTKDLD